METIVKSQQHSLFLFIVLAILSILSFSHDIQNTLFEQTKIDTTGHFFSFFCLALLVHNFVKLPLLSTLLCLTLYAALSEIGQYYLGFRHGEVRDFIADVLGISLFILLAWGYSLFFKKRSKNKQKSSEENKQ